MSRTLVTAPAAEPLTLADAKGFLRVDGADEDALITALVVAARRAGEAFTGRAWITQTWRLSLDFFPSRGDGGGARGALELPLPPLQSVASVTTYDDADTPSVFAAAGTFVDTASTPGRLVLRRGQTWPSALRVAGAIEIEFVAGYGDDASDVPEELRHGARLLLGHLYENREATIEVAAGELPLGARALWESYRMVSL